jgi:hypothetical protein
VGSPHGAMVVMALPVMVSGDTGRREVACGFDLKRRGLAISTGRISPRAMTTRVPRLVRCHSLMAKSFFKRMQPCEAG